MEVCKFKNIKGICMGGHAGVALKNDNTIVTWGIAEKGGRAPYLYYRYKRYKENNWERKITDYSNYNQFSNIKDINMTENSGYALKNDGTILIWGEDQISILNKKDQLNINFYNNNFMSNIGRKLSGRKEKTAWYQLNKIKFKELIPSNIINLALTENGDLYIFNTNTYILSTFTDLLKNTNITWAPHDFFTIGSISHYYVNGKWIQINNNMNIIKISNVKKAYCRGKTVMCVFKQNYIKSYDKYVKKCSGFFAGFKRVVQDNCIRDKYITTSIINSQLELNSKIIYNETNKNGSVNVEKLKNDAEITSARRRRETLLRQGPPYGTTVIPLKYF